MTADPRTVLDQLDEAHAKATPGPWHVDEGHPHDIAVPDGGADVGYVHNPSDAALIVAAVNALPRQAAAVRAALALHSPVEWQECNEDGVPDLDKPLPPFCRECTDDEWVSAVEFGDTIDLAANVVSWPCLRLPVTAALAAGGADQ